MNLNGGLRNALAVLWHACERLEIDHEIEPLMKRKRACAQEQFQSPTVLFWPDFLLYSDRVGTSSRNQHLQQSGRVAHVSCDCYEWF